MTIKTGFVDAALAVAVIGTLLAALGIASARESWDRLHYLSVLALVGPLPVAVAIVLQNGFTAQASIESLAVAALALATNPVATHVMGRAFWVRERGRLEPRGDEEVQG